MMEVERGGEGTEKEEAEAEVPEEQAETETDEDDDDFDLPSSTVPSRPSPSKLRTGATPFPRAASKGVLDVAQTLRDEVYESLIQEINSSSPTASKCGRPQASHADSTTVTLSWRPPAGAVGTDLLKYEIQFCISDDEQGMGMPKRSARSASVGSQLWMPIFNPCGDVRGGELGPLHTCSWVVNGLMTNKATRFRVRVTNVKAYGEWSEASREFVVGGCCYTAVGPGPGGDTWNEEEMALFMSLDTPMKVQDYLDTLPMNQEVIDDVSLNALEAVRQNHGHCLEGALLGAYILGLHGYGSRLMDLRSCASDDDHVVTVFQCNGRWGCLSVSNHSSLRYRNPVYRSLRELAISYFDDYMNGEGQRTLRSYSEPMDLIEVYGDKWWRSRGDNGGRDVAVKLDALKHYRLFETSAIKKGLRGADEFMMRTTVNQREWQYPPNVDEEALERNKNR